MKIRNLLLLSLVALFTSCSSGKGSSLAPGGSGDSGGSSGGGSEPTPSTPPSGETKISVPAHTLSDSNPSINVNAKGRQVTQTEWNNFKNGSASYYSNHYNFTYKAYALGNYTVEKFTKNGYYMQSNVGTLYYERKSGNTFYQYISTSEGYERIETSLNIQDKYTSRILNELYVHLDNYSDYEYDEDDGIYRYQTTSFSKQVKFVGQYLTYLHFGQTGVFYDIEASFETTIDIPASYYYK